MNQYKKIIKNQDARLKILHFLRFIPDSLMLKMQYKLKMKRKLHLKNPQRFTEKLQWYKIYYRNKTLTVCSDKFSVRGYVKSKGLETILVNLYNVSSDVDSIDFNLLPDKFVIKTTNGSGTNIFCTDKKKFNIDDAKYKLRNWLERDVYSAGREWSYKNIVPKVVVEELLEDKTNDFSGINDYKFMCFNGKPMYVVLDVDRHIDHKRNIYDSEWNYLNIETDHLCFGDVVSKPKQFNRMKEIASILSKDFPFVRVDLYLVNDKIYFGELTFYPWTGYVQFNPDKFDFDLGKEFIINKED